MIKSMNYAYNGTMHTQDHDPGCFITDTEPTVRRRRGRVLLYAHLGKRAIGVPAYPAKHMEVHRLNRSFNGTTY